MQNKCMEEVLNCFKKDSSLLKSQLTHNVANMTQWAY